MTIATFLRLYSQFITCPHMDLFTPECEAFLSAPAPMVEERSEWYDSEAGRYYSCHSTFTCSYGTNAHLMALKAKVEDRKAEFVKQMAEKWHGILDVEMSVDGIEKLMEDAEESSLDPRSSYVAHVEESDWFTDADNGPRIDEWKPVMHSAEYDPQFPVTQAEQERYDSLRLWDNGFAEFSPEEKNVIFALFAESELENWEMAI